MPKNIVICCDGTGNSFNNLNEDSNVAKLYSCLTIDQRQIGYYHPGVGTMGSPNARSWMEREWSRIKGLAFGAGLLDNVGDAYRYLMDNYVDGDQIYLFGFSRGAYTARALASLLHVYGLLCAGNHGAIPYILSMYSKMTRDAQRQKHTFETNEAFKWQFSHSQEVKIAFCGLWDTVSTYGWINDPIQLPFVGYNPIIEMARQAVSIHERRCFYQDLLWEEKPGRDVKQVWFVGVHSDVGGSYPEAQSGLSKVALEWMLMEAVQAHLLVDLDKVDVVLAKGRSSVPGLPQYISPDANDICHESLKGFWWIFEYIPQHDPRNKGAWYQPKGRRRMIPNGSYIHQSVLSSKWKPAWLPKNYQEEKWVQFSERQAAGA